MKISSQIIRLYYKTARRYKKLTNRLKRQVTSGEFQQSSKYAQNAFLSQLTKLRKRLADLKGQLTVAALAGAVSVILSASSVNAQSNIGPFVLQPREKNPLREPYRFEVMPAPTVLDADDDGDLDVFVGEANSNNGYNIRYFKNIGTRFKPVLSEQLYYDNPFFYKLGALYTGSAAPALGDVDGDGDFDAVVAVDDGSVKYFKNLANDPEELPDFEEQTGPWDENDFTGNPFENVSGDRIMPHLADFDGDGDTDLICGAFDNTNSYSATIFLLENDGVGNFSQKATTGLPTSKGISPITIDFDDDGDLDIVTGDKYGVLNVFINNGESGGVLQFEQLVEGNPYEGVGFGIFANPAFANLDSDSDVDLIVGYYPIEGESLYYIENVGDGTFSVPTGLNNPFGGIRVSNNASPTLADVNNDGLQDIIIGGAGEDEPLTYLKNVNHVFQEVPEEENPFASLSIEQNFTPSFVDLDGDGDKDLVGAYYYGIQYFVNNNGTFEASLDDPFSTVSVTDGKSDFVDIDNDGDYDLFVSDFNGDNEYYIRFFKNEGTATAPVFVFQDNPFYILENVAEEHALYPRFADIDHDGDFDALIGEGGSTVENYYSNEFLFYENQGDKENPFFLEAGELIPQFENAIEPSPMFFDFDRDGDLDLFQGDQYGSIHYYANENPAPVTTIDGSLFVSEEYEGSEEFFEDLSISNEDDDEMASAVIRLTNYQTGDELTFEYPNLDESTPSAAFTESGGVLTLTFTGKASRLYYQTLLRSLTFSWDLPEPTAKASTAKAGAPGPLSVEKSIRIQVFDVDNTTPATRTKPISLGIQNQAPIINNAIVSGVAGGTITLDLKTVISDVENTDGELTVTIDRHPTNGIANIDQDQILAIDYNTLSFSGTEDMDIKVCDAAGSCVTGTIDINITNDAPVFSNGSGSVVAGAIATVDLSTLFSDEDDNLVASTLQVTAQPASGATASIDANHNLVADYTGNSFTGDDEIEVQVCDITGTCASATVTVTVSNTAPVIEAISSNITAGSILTIDLNTMVSDADDNLVPSSLKVVGTLASGAVTTIDVNNTLSIDYTGLNFTGTETITVEACDIAGACVQNTITVTIPNTSPALASGSAIISFGGTATIALTPLMSDDENNADPNSLRVIQQPASGAVALIDGNSNLHVDYASTIFTGTETVTVEVCDLEGICVQNTFTITVINAPPVVDPPPMTYEVGKEFEINFLEITSDPDNNLVPTSFEVIVPPISRAEATFNGPVLTIDYSKTTYQEQDRLTVRVCDAAGACTDTQIVIDVNVINIVSVHNAVAPNGSSEANRYLHINAIPPKNRVYIYNRWGDLVYQASGYDNETVKFTGLNSNGNELASGSYFYKIEYITEDDAGRQKSNTVTGYLTLIQ